MVKGRGIKALKVLGGLIAFCFALLAGAVFLLNTDAFQNKLLKYATQMLSEKLQTRVEIDSISVGLFSQDVNLYGLDVEDLQHRKMLKIVKRQKISGAFCLHFREKLYLCIRKSARSLHGALVQ